MSEIEVNLTYPQVEYIAELAQETNWTDDRKERIHRACLAAQDEAIWSMSLRLSIEDWTAIIPRLIPDA